MLTEPITIQQATVADIPFLRAMIREALEASPTFLAHQDAAHLQQAEEQGWQQWREHSSPAFVAIDATGRKLGAITLRTHVSADGQAGWQIGIGVEADVRGQGIGQRLVEHAISYALALQSPYLVLLVDPANLPAIGLYRRTGFIEVGERENVIEMRLDLNTMVNELSASLRHQAD